MDIYSVSGTMLCSLQTLVHLTLTTDSIANNQVKWKNFFNLKKQQKRVKFVILRYNE